jgi:hypothetical protein
VHDKGDSRHRTNLTPLPHIISCSPALQLEWSFRQIVPVPKVFYWELPSTHELPLKIRVWHWAAGCFQTLVTLGESAGEIVANLTGVNSSSFDYVTATMTDQDWATSENYRRNLAETKTNGSEAMM